MVAEELSAVAFGVGACEEQPLHAIHHTKDWVSAPVCMDKGGASLKFLMRDRSIKLKMTVSVGDSDAHIAAGKR